MCEERRRRLREAYERANQGSRGKEWEVLSLAMDWGLWEDVEVIVDEILAKEE